MSHNMWSKNREKSETPLVLFEKTRLVYFVFLSIFICYGFTIPCQIICTYGLQFCQLQQHPRLSINHSKPITWFNENFYGTRQYPWHEIAYCADGDRSKLGIENIRSWSILGNVLRPWKRKWQPIISLIDKDPENISCGHLLRLAHSRTQRNRNIWYASIWYLGLCMPSAFEWSSTLYIVIGLVWWYCDCG